MTRLLFVLLTCLPIWATANPFTETTLSHRATPLLFEIHGSNTIGAELAPALVKAWLADRGLTNIQQEYGPLKNESSIVAFDSRGSTARIALTAHGTATGFTQLTSGRPVFAAASRPAKDSEITEPLLTTTSVIGIDGIAILVNPGINIDQLNLNLVGQLFSGEISNWQSITGENMPVTIFARDDNSGTFDTFQSLVLARGFKLSERAVRFESNSRLVAQINATPGAIGFAPISYANLAKPVAIQDGEAQPMAPNDHNIATEDYALSRRLYLYKSISNEFMDDFIEFVKSTSGQRMVSQTGFISQNIRELNQSLPTGLPVGYEIISNYANRINTNFRFQNDRNLPDQKALDDIERLAVYLNLPENTGRKLFLIGFSDLQRNEFKARLLSEARVMAIRRELTKKGIHAAGYSGYGQINPVAANVDGGVSLRNQRVEVWIR